MNTEEKPDATAEDSVIQTLKCGRCFEAIDLCKCGEAMVNLDPAKFTATANGTTASDTPRSAALADKFDEWCKSTEFDRTCKNPIDVGTQMGLRDAHDLLSEARAELATLRREKAELREVLKLLKSRLEHHAPFDRAIDAAHAILAAARAEIEKFKASSPQV